MKRLLATVLTVAALSACASNDATIPAPATTPPTVTAPTSSASSQAVAVANPCATGKDMGCGTPDAECATNRLGKQFVLNGVVYTCSEPKPYRWRKS